MKLVQRVFSSAAFWLLCAFAVAAAEPTDAQKEAMAAVERVHPDWREVDASAEFKKWIARQPQEVLDLGRGWAPNDIIRMLDLYKKDMVRLEPIVGTFEEGWTANERGDYSKALRIWRPLADRGDDWAQYNVGVLYQHGRGVPKDEGKRLAAAS